MSRASSTTAVERRRSISSCFKEPVFLNQVADPKTYARSTKWLITLLVAVASGIDPLSYAMLFPALPQLPEDLHTTESIANLSSALCFIGPAIMPLYWGFLAERYGRRMTYFISISLFTLFAGIAGAENNIAGLIVLRVLGSFCGCAVTVIGGAVVADIWEMRERGFAMSMYYLGPLTGPAVGPILGGALVYAWDWKATQWFLTCYGGLMLSLLFCFLPETSRKVAPAVKRGTIDSNTSSEPVTTTFAVKVKQTLKTMVLPIYAPFKSLVFLRHPSIAIVIWLGSSAFAPFIITGTSIQFAFSSLPYRFDYLIVGLLYIPMPLGLVPTSLIAGKWADRIMDRMARATAIKEGSSGEDGNENAESGTITITHRPEDRLRENAWISTIMLPCSLLFYGWTVNYGVFWFVPMVPWFLMGAGNGLILSLVLTVLTEMVPSRAPTMLALLLFCRNILCAIGGSVTQPLTNAIGTGWYYVALAAIAAVNVGFVGVFKRYGRGWREHVDEKYGIVRKTEVVRIESDVVAVETNEKVGHQQEKSGARETGQQVEAEEITEVADSRSSGDASTVGDGASDSGRTDTTRVEEIHVAKGGK